MGKRDLTKRASEYVFELVKTRTPGTFMYHDFTHFMEVAGTCEEIAEGLKLTEAEIEIVTLAGWFHDSGFSQQIEGHEEVGAQIARTFLENEFYPEEKIQKIVDCIMATKMPQSPKDLLEEIVCDADISHIGKKNFFDRSFLLRVELELTMNRHYSNLEWLQINFDFINSCNFRTKYANTKFEKQRIENYIKLRRQIQKRKKAKNKDQKKSQLQDEIISQKLLKKSKPGRGIETMFRITSTNHIRLSSLADNKAHIMISINSIIISVVIALLVRKLDANQHLIIPTFMLLLTSLASIIFATIATRPKITSGTFTKEEIYDKKANLLFFGNFFNMDLKDFSWGMNEMMNDKDYLYGSMIKDFYYLGKVLGQKYKNINICYSIFMYGMIASIIAFFIAIMMYPSGMDSDSMLMLFKK